MTRFEGLGVGGIEMTYASTTSVDPSQFGYTITDREYTASDGGSMLNGPQCILCGRTVAYHYQTADGKKFCIRLAPTKEPKP